MAEKQPKNPENAHLFQRLQTQLATMISTTEPGDRLLAEPELAKQLGVSRATLREAMRTFEGQGLIRRRQGVGTFVVGHPQVMKSGLEVLKSIETLAHQNAMNVSMGDLQIKQILADVEQAEALGLMAGDPLVQVARVIMTEKRPVAYLIDVLPKDILTPEELREGFTGSVLDFLLRRNNPSLMNSHTEIQAVAATSDIARALQIQRGDVLLKFIARLFDITGATVDYSLSYFLPGYFSFHVIRSVGVERSTTVPLSDQEVQKK